MGEITRRGYHIEWFIGDHGPKRVHVYDAKERFLGRLDIEQMRGIEGWMPSRKLIKVIEELKNKADCENRCHREETIWEGEVFARETRTVSGLGRRVRCRI